MKKKELLALLVAAVIFIGTGLIGVNSAKTLRENSLDLSSFGLGGEEATPAGKYVEQLNVTGAIAYDSGLSGESANVQELISEIYALCEDENNVGLLLYIDSPGGTMDASDDLYYALLDYKTTTERPIYCYFNSTACSGAYYIAMAADHITANRNCLCVNIGVYIATYNMSELYKKLGIEQMIFRSSDNKGIGMEGVPWTAEQLDIYQSIVDETYAQFVDVVAQGRGMSAQQVMDLNDGREMTAQQALNAGFIDDIDRYDCYASAVLEQFDEDVDLWEFTAESDWMQQLSDYFYQFTAQSETEFLRKLAKSHEGTQVMVYAGNY